jgi:hypothetical protein
MLSPTMAKAMLFSGSQASTAEIKYQWSVFPKPDTVVRSVVDTWSPGAAKLVVRLPGWPVMAKPAWPWAKYAVTARTDWALTGNLRGSETAKAPGGMMKPFWPEKVTVWTVSGRTALAPAEPLTGRATEAPVMGRSVAPKALLKVRRMTAASWVT